MELVEQALSFVHKSTQRTGYVTDGPWGNYDHEAPRKKGERVPYIEGTLYYACKWDDTGEDGEVWANDIDWIPATKRHITDGVRPCWCNPRIEDGLVIHNLETDNAN